MGKAIAITALVIVCVGIGAIAGGFGVYYTQPDFRRAESRTAFCDLVSVNSTVRGNITFNQAGFSKPLVMRGNIAGLSEGEHGFHIHEYGILSGDCNSVGNHFNPRNASHGSPQSNEHHVGDMGNVNVTSQDNWLLEERELAVSLFGAESIMGRSLVFHQNRDDFISQPTGNAGPKAACCTILHASANKVQTAHLHQ